MKTNNESKAIARAIHGWLTSYLPESRNFSRNTVKAYKDGITLYATFLQNVKSVSPENLSGACFSKDNINEWILWMRKERKCSPSTCNHRLACLKCFLKYLASQNVSFANAIAEAKEIRQLKCKSCVNIEISQQAIKELFGIIDLKTQIGRRDFAMFFFMYSIAARIDEVLSLRLKDLHLSDNGGESYAVIMGKGYKRRTPLILADVVKVLRGYIKNFHGTASDGNRHLFFSVYGGECHKLTQEAVSKRLKLYSNMAHGICPEVPPNLHCHILRHARASHWLEDGLNVVAIQRLMGHADINTTMRYIFVSTGQKSMALATLEDSAVTNTVKKWKEPRAKTTLKEYLALAKSIVP